MAVLRIAHGGIVGAQSELRITGNGKRRKTAWDAVVTAQDAVFFIEVGRTRDGRILAGELVIAPGDAGDGDQRPGENVVPSEEIVPTVDGFVEGVGAECRRGQVQDPRNFDTIMARASVNTVLFAEGMIDPYIVTQVVFVVRPCLLYTSRCV